MFALNLLHGVFILRVKEINGLKAIEGVILMICRMFEKLIILMRKYNKKLNNCTRLS